MKLSALEQVPLFEGRTPKEALEHTLRLAQGVEALGFERFWVAEHHNTSAFASSAPDLVMMHLLDNTERIRIGSGGVMSMHYGSLQVAERFATLATLHPGRVDLGMGRAPGGDLLAARALNQNRAIDPSSIDTLIEETVGFLRDELPAHHHYAPLEVRPTPETLPQMWLLGSSGQSAAWAGAHDLNYAYAQFFSGHQDPNVMTHYRAHLPAGARSGHTLSAMNVSAAATREEAWEQALVAGNFRLGLRSGEPLRFLRADQLSPERIEAIEQYLTHDPSILIGTYDEVADALTHFATNHGVEELMLISYIDDVETKIRQYGELAKRLQG